jgi:hypothetical protein
MNSSTTKSKLFYFILLSIIGILLPFGMEQNDTNTLSLNLKGLQNNFIGLRKNPQKYVKFLLNTDETLHPDAGGLYELLPYYKKVNALGEKTNYVIQWSDFENEWQLIKADPLGMFPRLDQIEETTVATLLTRDQFSNHTKSEIKAYKTLEAIKINTQNLAKQNKELKENLAMLEKELAEEKITKLNLKEDAKMKIEKLEKENDELHNKFFALEQKNKNLLVQQNAQSKILKSNAKEIAEYENKLSKLNPEKLQFEKKVLQEKIDQQTNKIDNLQEEKHKLEYIKNVLQEKEHQIPGFQKDITNCKKELKEKNQLLQNTKNELFETNKKLKSQSEVIDKLKEKVSDVQKENKLMKVEVLKANEVWEEIQKEKQKAMQFQKKYRQQNSVENEKKSEKTKVKYNILKKKVKDLEFRLGDYGVKYDTPVKRPKIDDY